MKIRSLGLLFLCFFSSALNATQPPVVNTVTLPLPAELYLHIFSFFKGDKKAYYSFRLLSHSQKRLIDQEYVSPIMQKAKSSNMFPLHYAIGRCDVFGVRALLSLGQNPSITPDTEMSVSVDALCYAAAMNTLLFNPPCAQIMDDEENNLHNQVWFCISRNLEKYTIPIQSLRLEAIEKLLHDKKKPLKTQKERQKKLRRN